MILVQEKADYSHESKTRIKPLILSLCNYNIEKSLDCFPYLSSAALFNELSTEKSARDKGTVISLGL